MLFVLGAQKYNPNNLATLLNFSDLGEHYLGFKLVFGFGPDSGYIFGFGPKLVGSFTTLVDGVKNQYYASTYLLYAFYVLKINITH